MNRQDCVSPRTAAQLERQYAFGKSFKEVLGIADDARRVAEEAKNVSTNIAETNNGIALRVKSLEEGLSGQFSLTIEKAEDEETGDIKVFSLIDGEATEIHFKSNSLIIESDFFKLDRTGKIYATGGRIGDCEIDENGRLVTKYLLASDQFGKTLVDSTGIVLFDNAGQNTTTIAATSIGFMGNSMDDFVSLSLAGLQLGNTLLTEADLQALLALI